MDQQQRALASHSASIVSVCIAHYRGVDLLADCIDSVLQQTGDVRTEIIVHDDASDPESLPFLATRYPQVKVIASDTNVGFCVANNRMVEQAKGEYILLLNNDAALFPDALVTLQTVAEEHPNAILTLPQYDWETHELVDRGCLLDPFYNPVPNLSPERSDVAMVIGACLWVGRHQWGQLGGFPEWLESIGEDMYLCCAARLAGLQVQALTKSGYRHRQGGSFGGNKATEGRLASTYRRRRYSERNKTFTLLVMTPTVLVWPLLLIHLIALLAEGLLFGLLRVDARAVVEIYLNVPRELVLQLPQLLRERKTKQASRQASLTQYLEGFRLTPRKLSMLYQYGLPKLTNTASR
ncbi:glycosyltransferase family 2 protein [Parahaliea mediterranea]|uniref:glycosyltransferase family 2 protein n=1 Tax=Parahaliea mediterranea TaxID=651086 RepID=UPI0019D4DF7A|nr:glycosyltransferase [Parahaliea mediterranea]